MVSPNSLDSVTKIFSITVRGLEPATQPPLISESSMPTQCQKDTCERHDL